MDTIVSGLGGVHGGSRATCQLGRARGQASAAARAAVRRVAGLGHRIETLELGLLHRAFFKGNFEVAADFHCSYIVEPDLALFKFQSMDVSPINYSR